VFNVTCILAEDTNINQTALQVTVFHHIQCLTDQEPARLPRRGKHQ